MSTTNSFNVSGNGTKAQKTEFEQRQIKQKEQYREFRVGQIEDDVEKNDIRKMMRHRDHEMDVKRDLDVETIEREIAAREMNSEQPTLEYHPKTPDGRTFSKMEAKDTIRQSIYDVMQPVFDQENKELLEEKNKEIDEAIDQAINRQEQSMEAGYEQSLDR